MEKKSKRAPLLLDRALFLFSNNESPELLGATLAVKVPLFNNSSIFNSVKSMEWDEGPTSVFLKHVIYYD